MFAEPSSDVVHEQKNFTRTAGIVVCAVFSFLVIGLTNDSITTSLAHHHLLYNSGGNADQLKSVSFFIDPLKSIVFFASTTLLLAAIIPATWEALRRLTRRNIGEAAGSFAICFLLSWTLSPISYGRSYARISVAPFDQLPGDMYRRLLMPGLAYLWHLDGFLYTLFFWSAVFLAWLLVKALLLQKTIKLSVLEGASLLTTGIFMTAFQSPGYPEIGVLLLALVALNAHGRRDSELVAISTFALALMTHEACAFIVFAPLLLFFYKPRVWWFAISICALYGLCMGLEFSFNLSIPAHMQTTVSSEPASSYFKSNPGRVLVGAFSAFKLLWFVIAAGFAGLWRQSRREALFVVSSLALAIASTYIAVDYTRMIAFAFLALLVCLAQAKQILPARLLTLIMVVNLIWPSVLIYGNNAQAQIGRGGYALLCRALRLSVQQF